MNKDYRNGIRKVYSKKKQKPDLIKIDVEGYKYEIFKGSAKFFKENLPPTICELHLKILNKVKIDYLFSIFKNYNNVLVVAGIDLPYLNSLKLEDIYRSIRSTITVFLSS